MGSKTVRDKQKSAEAVQAAAKTHKEAVVVGVDALIGPEVGSAAGLIIERSTSRLSDATGTMVAADDAHLKELADDAAGFTKRDASADAVYGDLSDFREVGHAVYGEAYMHRLGLEGTTPRDPVALDRLATLVLDNLAEVSPPAPRRDGLLLDTAAWTAPLTASRAALSAALSAVALEKREAEATLVAKNEAIDRYDQVFSITATLVSTLLAAAGEKELARRVRPSSRRPGQTTEVAETPDKGAADDPAPSN